MSRRSIVLVLAALGVLALGLVVMLNSLSPNEAASSSSDASSGAATGSTSATTRSTSELAAPEANSSAASTDARAAIESTDATSSITAADDPAFANARWVEGRVVFPAGTPGDEELWVVADGRRFANKKLHRAKVDEQGRFRIAFHPKATYGRVTLDARYLYLPRGVKLDFDEALPELVLEPKLGGRIVGRLRLPAGAEDRRASAIGNTATWSDGSYGDGQRTVSAKVDAELRFALGGISPNVGGELHVQLERCVPIERKNVRVEAGGTQTLELDVHLGVMLSGRVLDEEHKPVRGVMVMAQNEGGPFSFRQKTSADDGSVILAGLEPGRVVATAFRQGFVAAKLELDDLREGDVRKDLEWVLRRGTTLSGRVTWPDGTPAAGADVVARLTEATDPGDWMQLAWGSHAKADAQGAFSISGLQGPAYDVRASAQRDPPRDPVADGTSAEAAGKPAKRARNVNKQRGVIALQNVRADAGELALVLGSGLIVRGQVVDDAGAPHTRFRVSAVPQGESDGEIERESVTKRFESASGAFELEGLDEGEWRIQASVERSQSQPVTLTPPAGALQLVVARAGSVEGEVRDPAGKPFANARVKLSRASEESEGPWDFESSAATRSATNGSFAFRNAPAGQLRVRATAPGFAASSDERVTLAPGGSARVVVVLRVGGRIEGTALTRDGLPESGREIAASPESADGGEHANVLADDAGRFVFEHVAPGRWRVETQSGGSDFTTDGQERAPPRLFHALVDVVDGQTSKVSLGGALASAVRVRGHVRAGTKAVPGAVVSANPSDEDEEDERSAASANTDASGRYELVLDRPGAYQFQVSAPESSSLLRQVDVPAGPSAEIDFDLGSARISGRVIGSDGQPLANAWVMLMPVDEPDAAQGSSHGSRQTDAQGRFRFESLAAGEYSLRASVMSFSKSSRNLCAAQRERLVLAAGAALDDIELRIEQGGTIVARVAGAGAGDTEEPELLLFDANGRPWSEWSGSELVGLGGGTVASWRGRRRIQGVPPGRMHALARTATGVSRLVAFEVRANETTEVELALGAGTFLDIHAEDAQGKPVEAKCELRSESGVDLSTLFDGTEWTPPAPDAPVPTRLGPLPAGTCTLTVRDAAGHTASAEVRCGASERRVVRLRIAE